MQKIGVFGTLFLCLGLVTAKAQKVKSASFATVTVGAARFDQYWPLIKGKKLGLVVNQTSVVGPQATHLVDTLRARGADIRVIFAPEHGFRGDADAGEHIDNSRDARTGIPLVAIYGKKYKPDAADLTEVDVLLYDIQDVGLRFYTYISTLQYTMEAAAEHHKKLIVLDRPNPNGHYVDGPVLDTALRSFVGMQPIPIVYGMTPAEYAQMLNTEGWLAQGLKADLEVVRCRGYNHRRFYQLSVKPSPNLPNMRAIYLYPELCLFEGTRVSVGRGTPTPFEVYGSPFFPADLASHHFTPTPNAGAKKPFMNGQICHGFDLSGLSVHDLQQKKQLNFEYLRQMYKWFSPQDSFFIPNNNFFDKLAGTYLLRQQLVKGVSVAEMRASWQPGLKTFKAIRKKYLLYKDF